MYEPEPIELVIGSHRLSLLQVKDLEQFVDREALLRDDTAEPPYWAYLWTGSTTLARYVEELVECQDQHVLDLGCGLGLTGVVAALKGAQVTFADKEPDALGFAAANAQRNGCTSFDVRLLDFTCDVLGRQFGLILGAEILYDRPTFPLLVEFLACHLSPGGKALLADAKRTNTAEFYQLLDRAGLLWTREEVPEREEHLPLSVSIVAVQRHSRGKGS
jgi:predicted nicotinamide N-methyase